jgi:uncharacterized membrane protein
MRFIDTAKNAVQTAAESATTKGKELLAEHGTGSGTGPAGPVSLTVSADEGVIRAVWRDTTRLSQVLGDIASAEAMSDSKVTFTASTPQGDITVNTTVVDDVDGIRFVSSSSSAADTEIIIVRLADAPGDLGTEVTLRLALPLPDFAAETAAFKILYRMRALVQTGEIPTLVPTPAARPGNR